MKKVIVISIMSLLFLATYAQRPTKSTSTEVNNSDRNKSEMTTNRSDDNPSRSIENKSDRSDNGNTSRTYTPVNNDDHSRNDVNIDRNYTPRNDNNNSGNANIPRTNTQVNTDDHSRNDVNINRNYTPGNDNNNSGNTNIPRTNTQVNTDDRSRNDVNINRNYTPENKEEYNKRNAHNEQTYTAENEEDDPPVNVNREYRSYSDKIVEHKTDVHKNIEYQNDYTNGNGRINSINARQYEAERKNYHTPPRQRVYREVYHVEKPNPIEYRRIYYPYPAPEDIDVIWNYQMYHEYCLIYPEYHYWYYPTGYYIRTVSAYDAMYYIGEIMNIYGRIYEAWYSWQTDEYYLYFGARYPYHDFSVVISGQKARQFNRRPELFFEGRYIWVTGLISLNDGKPEMIVRKKHQIHFY